MEDKAMIDTAIGMLQYLVGEVQSHLLDDPDDWETKSVRIEGYFVGIPLPDEKMKLVCTKNTFDCDIKVGIPDTKTRNVFYHAVFHASGQVQSNAYKNNK